MSRQYGLPCPVARSLDIIGDRWTLLIIRDLLAVGPRKYVDLSESLKGIAPNVLSDRLKLLESNGLVEREFYEQHPPRALYKLTKRRRSAHGDEALVTGATSAHDGVSVVHERCGRRQGGRVLRWCGARRAAGVRMKYREREATAALERST
jgi:DNA-binding HxlR family transcriptional regulator